jgi:hypothetical protein
LSSIDGLFDPEAALLTTKSRPPNSTATRVTMFATRSGPRRSALIAIAFAPLLWSSATVASAAAVWRR